MAFDAPAAVEHVYPSDHPDYVIADGDPPIEMGRPLYKFDTKGKLRVWWMDRQGAKKRTVAGLDAGKRTISAWTVCKGKQKRTDEEQAQFEINADYTYGLKRDYFETPQEAVGGARFFEPMLAEKWKDITWAKMLKRLADAGVIRPDTTGVYAQPKLDGFCCIAQKSGMTSREGEPIVSAPHIMEALAPLFEENPEAVFHGELYNHALKEDFEALSSILKKQKNITEEQFAYSREMAQFHIYDYPAPGIRDLPFVERSERLLADLDKHGCLSAGILHFVETHMLRDDAHMEELRQGWLDDGYEGAMGRLNLPYEQKRSWSVLKLKLFDDAEFEVEAIVEGKGNYAGYAKRVTCRLPDGRTFGAGIKGGQSKFNAELLGEAGQCQKIVTIRHFGWTKDGKPRMGVAIKWHGEARTL